jgi:hypothetical protein
MKNTIALAICFIICHLAGYSAPVYEGKSKLDEVFKSERDFATRVLDKGGCWYLNYTLFTVALNDQTGLYETVQTDGELIATKDARCVKTNLVESYMDSYDVFTVMKDQQVVLRTPSSKAALRSGDNPYFRILKDTFFRKYQLVSSTEVNDLNTRLLRYDYKLRDGRKAPYSLISLFIDPKAGMFRKMFMQINSSYTRQAKSYTLIVNARKEKAADPTWHNMKQKFLSSDGRLKAPYNTYRYKDSNTN